MISVRKDFDAPPASLTSDTTKKHIKTAIDEGQRHKTTDRYKQDDIKEQLDAIYQSKCAYCEGKSQAQAPYQVEHYRPKNEVKEDTNHPGYYWLSYEWSNLLWACFWCNNPKSSQFPIKDTGTRIYNPPLTTKGELDSVKCRANFTDLVNEQALVLNPELDNPNEHLKFLPNGFIEGLTDEGRKTIEVCNLNRNSLVIVRKKKVDDFADDIQEEVTEYLANLTDIDYFKRNVKKILAKISKSGLPENEYSRLGYFMFVEFKEFFAENPNFDTNTKRMLSVIYNEFKVAILT